MRQAKPERGAGGSRAVCLSTRIPAAASNEELCILAQRGSEAALDLLYRRNQGLVRQMASRYYRAGSELDFEDLVSEGAIGFLTAVTKFAPERGNKLTTVAYWWIRQAISRAMEAKGMENVSLDQPAGGEGDACLADLIADPHDLEQATVDAVWVRAALARLPPRERAVLALRFGLSGAAPLSLTQIAERVGRTRQGTRNIEKRALQRLRAAAG